MPGVASLAAIALATAAIGYAVTAGPLGGRRVRTTDGGRTWSQTVPTGPTPLHDVRMVGADVGYALGGIGDPRAVLRTGDGGKTWRTVGHLPGPADPFGGRPPAFAPPSEGAAIGLDGGLDRTVDDSRAWIRAGGTAAGQAFAVGFVDRDGCVPPAHAPRVRRDGGRTWRVDRALALPNGGDRHGVRRPARTDRAEGRRRCLPVPARRRGGGERPGGQRAAWATEGASLYRSVDGGRTWTRPCNHKAPDLGTVMAPSFGAPLGGDALHPTGLYRTTDGRRDGDGAV